MIAPTSPVQYKTWNWGNKFGRHVPETFVWPTRLPLELIYNLWVLGNASLYIRPYSLIDKISLKTRADKKNQSIAKCVCSVLSNYMPSNYSVLSFQQQQSMMKDAISEIRDASHNYYVPPKSNSDGSDENDSDNDNDHRSDDGDDEPDAKKSKLDVFKVSYITFYDCFLRKNSWYKNNFRSS